MTAAASIPPRPLNGPRIWLRIHRWVALGAGWVVAAVGLMGAVLVVARPVDRAIHPELFQASPSTRGAPAAALEPMRQRLVGEFGTTASFTFRPPRDADDTLWVLVRGAWNGTVYLSPSTGLEQGRRGDAEGLVNILFKMHSSLLMQETGKAILAWLALSYLVLLVSGLVRWWPRRWSPSFAINLRGGLIRGLFDLHRVAGTVMGLFIAVSVASGAYMAWRPLGEFVTVLNGSKATKAPAISEGTPTQAVPATLDHMVSMAQAQFPHDPIGYIQVPGQSNRPVRIRMKLADDPHPNGLTSIWLHPRSGAILAVNRWNELDPGARAVSVVYPLHVGELGGTPHKVLIFLSGSTLGLLGFTGVWLWWRRRTS